MAMTLTSTRTPTTTATMKIEWIRRDRRRRDGQRSFDHLLPFRCSLSLSSLLSLSFLGRTGSC